MRSFLFTAFFLAMTLPACAQSPAQSQERPSIYVGGYEIAEPVQVDHPLSWDAVSPYMPEHLYEQPLDGPLTAREIYNQVNGLMREKMASYEAALAELARERQDQYPDKSLEQIEFILADQFVTGAGMDISADVQVLAYEYAALLYLQEAFSAELEKQGYNPKSHAPGAVPR